MVSALSAAVVLARCDSVCVLLLQAVRHPLEGRLLVRELWEGIQGGYQPLQDFQRGVGHTNGEVDEA